MKIVVIGDTHDNIANVIHVMGFAKKIKASAVIHTGDWSSPKVVDTVLDYKIQLYAVSGNADVDPYFNSHFDNFLEFKLDGKNVAVVHKLGNIYSQKYNNWDIIFTGHYHSQTLSSFSKNGNLYRSVRPGSLEKEIMFAIYDTKTDKVEFINLGK